VEFEVAELRGFGLELVDYELTEGVGDEPSAYEPIINN
jgi:hypothetical protein